MTFKLYELKESYQRLLEYITESEEPIENFSDTLEAIEDAMDEKLNAVAVIYKTTLAHAEALKQEEARLRKRRQAYENNADRLKAYAQDALEATGRTKVIGSNFTLRIQNNPPSVQILDDKAIPAQYLIENMPSIDKKGIAEDLKKGIHVEGAELKKTKSIRIL